MNVLDAAQERLARIFKDFQNVYVSFSGGKDSGVLLNLSIDFIRKNYPGRRLGVFHIDYEAQYQMTTDYVDAVLSDNTDILDVYRICLPIAAQCSTSMHNNYWIPWDKDKKELWVRPLPSNGITEDNHTFPWFVKGMWDYDVQNQFGEWYQSKCGGGKTACLVGIRTQESLNRWRAIHSDKNQNKYDGLPWTLEVAMDVCNAYPIFDWITEDVWTANAKFGWSYNRLYDLFWQAGLSIDQMRVASPFNNCAMDSLKLYKAIDPNTWGKMIGRTNGVNFAGMYGGTTAMGWKSIKLPPGHTWKSYMEFLLSTLPDEAKKNYLAKLEVSKKVWSKSGGALSEETIGQLESEGAPLIRTHSTGNRSDKEVVRFEDYMDDSTIDDFSSAPTYKRMCVCIIKNDHACKFMGFTLNKTEMALRASAESKYKDLKLPKSAKMKSEGK